VSLTPFSGVRRATLADVAAVARLAVPAIQETLPDGAPVDDPIELSPPELALRLLEDLDDGNLLYVAERDGRIIGFAQVSGLMVGDGGHLVELRRLYVAPEHRSRGIGRRLLSLVVRDLRKRANSPSLRAWAPAGTSAGAFLEATGGAIVRQRWRVGPGDLAVRGVVYGWRAVPAATAATPRGHALA
jgi:GNAT superfamily N-acetyltransferase